MPTIAFQILGELLLIKEVYAGTLVASMNIILRDCRILPELQQRGTGKEYSRLQLSFSIP